MPIVRPTGRVSEADAMAVAAPVAQSERERRPAPAPVTLVQFPLVWGRNVSPFTLKLETWLRLAEIPYSTRETTELRTAPRHKLPYIEDDGRRIGDSSLIIAHLKATRGIDPDAGLSARELAEALALQRLLEDHLYYVIAYSRWIDPVGWASVGEAFFEGFPPLLRAPARVVVRRRMARLLHIQGLGRYSRDEVYAMGRDDLRAAADLLGDRPFFLGERLSSIDAVAFGFLANILLVPIETELKRMAQDLPSLVTWVETMEAGLGA
jgi:glutathione S-transferase